MLHLCNIFTARVQVVTVTCFNMRSPSIIFQWSWESGEVPVNWKLANVVSILKQGKKEYPGNCRPVSLTSVPSKIIKKVIIGDFEKHLRDNAYIRHSQHRFTMEKSCLTNVISFYHKVTHLVDHEKPVDLVRLDFSKAFDTVSHSILLDKTSSNTARQVDNTWGEQQG